MKLILSKYYTLFFCTIWIFLLSSLNSPPFHPIEFNFFPIITFIRGIAPLVVLLFIICYYLFTKFNKKNTFTLIDLLLIIYFISQIFSYIYTNGWVISKDIYWPLSGLSLLFFLDISKNYDKKNLIHFLNISVFFIGLFSSYLIYQIFDEFYLNFFNESYFFNASWYSANAIAETSELLGQEIPRSSGLARMLFLVFAYLLITFLYKKNFNDNKKVYLITGLLIFIFSFCIWHIQNRLVVLYYFILIIFFIIPFDNIKFIKKIYLLLIFFIIPFTLHTVEPILRKNLLNTLNPNLEIKNNLFMKTEKVTSKDLLDYDYGIRNVIKFKNNVDYVVPPDSKIVKINGEYFLESKNGDLISLSNKNLDFSTIISITSESQKVEMSFFEIVGLSNRFVRPYITDSKKKKSPTQQNILLSNTSGRFELWKLAVPYISQNYFGYGPQADRIYVKQNISNLTLYSLLSSGIIGFISIISIYFLIIFKIIKLVFLKQIFKKKDYLYEKISIIIVGFLLLRSLVEVSFGILSIDMIFFLVALKIIYHSPINNKIIS